MADATHQLDRGQKSDAVDVSGEGQEAEGLYVR